MVGDGEDDCWFRFVFLVVNGDLSSVNDSLRYTPREPSIIVETAVSFTS